MSKEKIRKFIDEWVCRKYLNEELNTKIVEIKNIENQERKD
ncbi:hypothetical protein [Thermoflavimicrobium dichotomicum]|nr:hypothetical protein [Thermoflavimicrobium dichotomicum]